MKSTRQVIAFVIGFVVQSLRVTFGIFTVGVLSCCFVRPISSSCHSLEKRPDEGLGMKVVLPPWDRYNSHPVNWLPDLESEENTIGAGEGIPETKKEK